MSTSDPIADLLTRIRNGLKGQHRYVDVRWSRIKQELAEILKSEGFIEDYLVRLEGTRGEMRLFLKYAQGRKPVIQGLKRVSRPGRRQYVTFEEIPIFFGGLGVAILSTSQGLLPGREAKKRHIGGELLCQVW
jgi:small subunit ribosomal protein S8